MRLGWRATTAHGWLDNSLDWPAVEKPSSPMGKNRDSSVHPASSIIAIQRLSTSISPHRCSYTCTTTKETDHISVTVLGAHGGAPLSRCELYLEAILSARSHGRAGNAAIPDVTAGHHLGRVKRLHRKVTSASRLVNAYKYATRITLMNQAS